MGPSLRCEGGHVHLAPDRPVPRPRCLLRGRGRGAAAGEPALRVSHRPRRHRRGRAAAELETRNQRPGPPRPVAVGLPNRRRLVAGPTRRRGPLGQRPRRLERDQPDRLRRQAAGLAAAGVVAGPHLGRPRHRGRLERAGPVVDGSARPRRLVGRVDRLRRARRRRRWRAAPAPAAAVAQELYERQARPPGDAVRDGAGPVRPAPQRPPRRRRGARARLDRLPQACLLPRLRRDRPRAERRERARHGAGRRLVRGPRRLRPPPTGRSRSSRASRSTASATSSSAAWPPRRRPTR